MSTRRCSGRREGSRWFRCEGRESARSGEESLGGRGNVLEAGDDGDHAEDDEGKETVAQYRCCPVRIDATLGHEVEESVDGSGADEGDAVDVGKLRFARLRRRPRLAQFATM